MTQAETVTIRLAKGNFEKGLKYAKSQGGKFNGETKTWEIPASSTFLNAPHFYGWVIVTPLAAGAGHPPYGTKEWFEHASNGCSYCANDAE